MNPAFASSLAALTSVMENSNYAIPEAYVFQNDNVKTVGKITYYPIYMLMFLERDRLEEKMIYKLDLNALQ